jgi:hypothetical protein
LDGILDEIYRNREPIVKFFKHFDGVYNKTTRGEGRGAESRWREVRWQPSKMTLAHFRSLDDIAKAEHERHETNLGAGNAPWTVPWDSYWELFLVKVQAHTSAYDDFIDACDDHLQRHPADLTENWINDNIDKMIAKEDRHRQTARLPPLDDNFFNHNQPALTYGAPTAAVNAMSVSNAYGTTGTYAPASFYNVGGTGLGTYSSPAQLPLSTNTGVTQQAMDERFQAFGQQIVAQLQATAGYNNDQQPAVNATSTQRLQRVNRNTNSTRGTRRSARNISLTNVANKPYDKSAERKRLRDMFRDGKRLTTEEKDKIFGGCRNRMKDADGNFHGCYVLNKGKPGYSKHSTVSCPFKQPDINLTEVDFDIPHPSEELSWFQTVDEWEDAVIAKDKVNHDNRWWATAVTVLVICIGRLLVAAFDHVFTPVYAQVFWLPDTGANQNFVSHHEDFRPARVNTNDERFFAPAPTWCEYMLSFTQLDVLMALMVLVCGKIINIAADSVSIVVDAAPDTFTCPSPTVSVAAAKHFAPMECTSTTAVVTAVSLTCFALGIAIAVCCIRSRTKTVTTASTFVTDRQQRTPSRNRTVGNSALTVGTKCVDSVATVLGNCHYRSKTSVNELSRRKTCYLIKQTAPSMPRHRAMFTTLTTKTRRSATL